MGFKFKTQRRPLFIDLPGFPQLSSGGNEAPLSGYVQEKDASAGEENLAGGLDASRLRYIFRHVIGAPKGLPGWKEVDFIVFTRGLIYAIEVDTAFTHRNKEQKDRLHDAIILNDQELRQYGQLYPQVLHVDGEVDIPTRAMAKAWVQRTIGRG